ncbi:glycosyltransferase [Deinococcus taeanensis]|uniref:glycosyltransferase n=1 Tax=Deinococcus taeanensis TaxID=2737050 RepID=UPI001CDBC9F1|nr:glycosyltransferase [Deinococcus taeanensis]UBV42720.1 glycosyltransferase [Deinococcus taeanensis]
MTPQLNYDVLVILDYYLPSRKAGGPVTTIVNLTELLGDEMRFLILTRRRDIDGKVYDHMPAGRIMRVGKADVIYLDDSKLTLRDLTQYAQLSGATTLYLNSFFSPLSFSFLLLRRLGQIKMDVILAPRGEFSRAAYVLKGAKKELYRQLVDRMGLLRGLRWQVSSAYEAQELKQILGERNDVMVAPDPFSVSQSHKTWTHDRDLIYLSRICRNKNLHYALQCLAKVRFPVSLDIYGPIEDTSYWEECQAHIKTLPSHVQVQYCGVLAHEQVRTTFSHYGAFLFPTGGENYGHVIPEALSAGTPVILSDRTPWRDFEEAGVGYVLPLEAPESFVAAVEVLVGHSPQEREAIGARCQAYAQAIEQQPQVRQQNIALFTQPFKRGQL